MRLRSTIYVSDTVANRMPLIDPRTFAAGIRDTVPSNPDHYVVAPFWRTFYERMYMLVGFEELMMEIATHGELFGRMLSNLRDFTIQGIELIAETGIETGTGSPRTRCKQPLAGRARLACAGCRARLVQRRRWPFRGGGCEWVWR